VEADFKRATITKMPISRFLDFLVSAYNPAAADLPLGFDAPAHIRDFHVALHGRRRMTVGQHCYGCTAGSGIQLRWSDGAWAGCVLAAGESA